MSEPKDIRRLGRAALTALCIGVAVGAITAGPLGGVAQAKNGGDHGGNGHGGGNGNGGGNGGGHTVDHSQGQQHGPSGNAGAGGTHSSSDSIDNDTTTTAESDDDSMTPQGRGKLNGFFHASPTALANASPTSSIGRISKTFADALTAYAAAKQQQTDGTTTTDGTTPPTGPSLDDLGDILAAATNKPVTAAQVKAIVERLADVNPTNPGLADFAANATPEDCQKIADAANAAREGGTTSTDNTSTDQTSTGDTSTGDTSGGDASTEDPTITTTTTTTASE